MSNSKFSLFKHEHNYFSKCMNSYVSMQKSILSMKLLNEIFIKVYFKIINKNILINLDDNML